MVVPAGAIKGGCRRICLFRGIRAVPFVIQTEYARKQTDKTIWKRVLSEIGYNISVVAQ